MMMPFIKSAPMVTFKKPIGSVSVSGHKFVGAPVPCGVVMTRMRLVMALSSDVEYLNSRDATIMGSRNGHAAIYLWYNLTKKGYEGFRKDVEVCMRNAHFLREMISRAGIWVMLNELSNTGGGSRASLGPACAARCPLSAGKGPWPLPLQWCLSGPPARPLCASGSWPARATSRTWS